jgi:hypothetical protein
MSRLSAGEIPVTANYLLNTNSVEISRLLVGKKRMTEKEIAKAKFITEYLYKNYHDDCKRMASIPMVPALINHASLGEIPSLIDKLAILNNVKKSYPPIVINA